MFIDKFYNNTGDKIRFSRQQASDFAKQIADDFNPLHNIEAKRFCVPGDLLFAVTLARAGLHQQMRFKFSGMVTDENELHFPTTLGENVKVTDANDKEYLEISAAGDKTTNPALIESLVKAYVGFSGHTFPHLLVELMARENVMINPARPMIMYESMAIDLKRLDVAEISLELAKSELTIDGKRGNACLTFNLLSEGEMVGHGEKHMILSGLREFDQATMDNIANDYNAMKAAYQAA
ncbi:DUF3581 domain-containing protein [Thalassomonas viridans]|uniref:DUF3581 domain-containing protein n=2 Tax=Thalassomonas viridans TaxID=137584 RepID=A0AAE9Z825_9GAMM|nr:DUF3581 family protein [Thalassomonas viridans]WDE08421.1 DUF3581 domain-containing protein [Thalassomonas viridans]